MNKEKRRVPKLRFPGFTEDWEQCKLGSIGSTYTGLSGKTKEDFGHGEAQYITYLNVFQNTVSDITITDKVEIDTTQNEVKYGDVLFTTSSETPEEVGMSSVWLGHMPNIYLNSFCFGFRPNQKIDPYFLGYSLRAPYMRDKMKILAQGISRYNISKNKVMELEISLSNNEEQRLLGNFLRNIDLSITLHQRKLEHLNLKKKALLQKLFPKNGERYPELRFPGFTDAWEQRELSSLTEYIGTGKSRFVINEFGEYAILGSTNVIGYDNDYDYDGNFILTARVGANAGQLYRYSGKVKITDNTVFIMSDSSQFIYYTLTYFDLRRLSFGTGQPLVKSSELQKLKLCVPVSKSEQEKIGEIFNNIDNIITLHQRKLEHLQLQKKALLQQLFI